MVPFKCPNLSLFLPVIVVLHLHVDVSESNPTFQRELEQSVKHFKLNLHKTLEESRIRNRKRNAYSVHIDQTNGKEVCSKGRI